LVWDVVRRAQKAAFEAARPGAEAQPLEAVARRVVEEAGFVPGEIGIRHEGCIYITQDGAANMTRWWGSPEDPAVIKAAVQGGLNGLRTRVKLGRMAQGAAWPAPPRGGSKRPAPWL
jgi:hypothetical protein